MPPTGAGLAASGLWKSSTVSNGFPRWVEKSSRLPYQVQP